MADDKRHDAPDAAARTKGGAAPGAQIVSLADIAQDTRYPILGEVERYWQGLRGSRLVPARSEIDPRQIEDALEYAFILERIAPGMGRFRLAGMHLNDLMGMEVRGMPLSAFLTPDARAQMSPVLEEVFDAPAIVRLTLAGERGIGRPPLDARLLLLPLKSDFGDVSRALGCLATLGPMGRTPRRFEIVSHEVAPLAGPNHAGDRRIRGWSAPRRPTALPADPKTEAPELVEPAARYSAAPATPRPPRSEGRPALYLVSSND